LIAGLIVLLIGWIIAAALRRVINALLTRTGLDAFLVRHKLVGRTSAAHAGSRTVAGAVYWAILLIALMQAAKIWGLGFVAGGLAAAISFLPNIIAAVLIFGVAVLLGNWVRDRMRTRAVEQRSTATFLPEAVRAAILTVGAFIALRQLQIAPDILTIVFALVFGGIAVAIAIAVGLGGRSTVERMSQDWYDEQRARRGLRQTQSGGRTPPSPTTGGVSYGPTA
jgi:hypothetical protein